jgi:hypothetical protein
MKAICRCGFLLSRLFLGGAFLLLSVSLPWRACAQLSTIEHLAKPGFWPTQISKSSADFVGSAACAKCHPQIAASQRSVPMALTVARAADAEVLHSHPHLKFERGRYKYEIVTSAAESTYTVTDGSSSLSALLSWAFGAGPVGQSYLYLRDGHWYEARASFFGTLNNLQFTPGRALSAPRDLEEATSRPVSNADVVRCFRCHATGVTSEYSVDTARLQLGISCEACHGPGGNHVATMEAEVFVMGVPRGESDQRFIFNPRRLDPTSSVEFCGACHSTWWDVRLSGANGHATLLSPAYRLVNSKCWRKGDSRLACTACHDPHAPRERQPEAYDAKCLACHLREKASLPSAGHPGRACPVSTSKCTACHMPKVDVPDLHYAITDHEIRIARAGENFPK